MLIPGRDDILRIHREVMERTGDRSREYDGMDTARLDSHLKTAGIALAGETDAVTVVAWISCQVARSEAFMSGTIRTALATAAVVAELNGLDLRGDWREYADLLVLAADQVGGLSRAVEQTSDWLRRHRRENPH